MDPNFKNFLNWKKSNKGREFLAKQDENEISNLQQKGKTHFLN
jgi:hypothetical protein